MTWTVKNYVNLAGNTSFVGVEPDLVDHSNQSFEVVLNPTSQSYKTTSGGSIAESVSSIDADLTDAAILASVMLGQKYSF